MSRLRNQACSKMICWYELVHSTNGALPRNPDRRFCIDLGCAGLGRLERSARSTDFDSRVCIMVGRRFGHHGLSHAQHRGRTCSRTKPAQRKTVQRKMMSGARSATRRCLVADPRSRPRRRGPSAPQRGMLGISATKGNNRHIGLVAS